MFCSAAPDAGCGIPMVPRPKRPGPAYTAQSIDTVGDNLCCVEGESEMRIVVRRRDGMEWGMKAGRRRPR